MGIAKELVRRVQEDDVLGISAELAYRLLFAMFPFLIFLAALSSYAAGWLGIENPTQEILNDVGDALPEDAAGILESQLANIFDNRNPGLLSITAIAALWTASSGTKTIMKALNRAYDVEESRSFIRKQAVGLLLTLVGGVAFIAAAIVIVVGQAAGQDIANSLGMGATWGTVVTWLRIPVVLVLIAAGAGFLYWAAPAANLPWRWFTWGAAIFVVAWLVATLGFALYVSNFAEYSNTYGALAGIIILMTWLYITSLVLLLGAELNVVLERRLAGNRLPEEQQATQRRRQRQERELREGAPTYARSAAGSSNGSSDGARHAQESRPRRRGEPEEVQVERRMPPGSLGSARGQLGAVSTALGAMIAGIVLARLWSGETRASR